MYEQMRTFDWMQRLLNKGCMLNPSRFVKPAVTSRQQLIPTPVQPENMSRPLPETQNSKMNKKTKHFLVHDLPTRYNTSLSLLMLAKYKH